MHQNTVFSLLPRILAATINLTQGDVVAYDGLYHGQTDMDGNHRIQTETPKFSPETFEVKWKSLPRGLMYQILGLPNQAWSAQSMVGSTFEHCAFPPDFVEEFEERQWQYATLGLNAAAFAEQLRRLVELGAPTTRNWDPIHFMGEEISKIDGRRGERE